MEQTIGESDSYLSKDMVNQMFNNNLLNETTPKNNFTKFSQSFVENKVPDIKLELERNGFHTELVPHFKPNTFVSESPEHDMLTNLTKATSEINTVDRLVYEEWKPKIEEITIKAEKDDDRSPAQQEQAEIKLKTSDSMANLAPLEELDLYKGVKIKKEIIIKEEEPTMSQGRLGVREAAKPFRIDKSKLSRSLNNKNRTCNGKNPALSVDEENDLTERITVMAQCGFALSKEEIKCAVQTYVNKNNLITVFKNGKPGNRWFQAFFRRNGLSRKKMVHLEKCQRTVTSDPFIIYSFYNKLQETINKLGLQDKPSHIFNLDETSFNFNYGRVKCVTAIGQRVHRSIEGSGKENVTTMACISADGELLPPLIIYQGQNLCSTWKGTQDIKNTCYAVSDRGLMTAAVFNSWFQTFCKMIKQRPLLVIMDGQYGHVSHLDGGTIELAIENNVTLFKIPPRYAIDLLQPLDRCYFGPLKLKWNRKLVEWQRLNQRKLTKSEFANMICELWYEGISRDVIKRSFETTGLYPCNKEKYPKERLNQVKLKKYNECVQPDTFLNMYDIKIKKTDGEPREDEHNEGEETKTDGEPSEDEDKKGEEITRSKERPTNQIHLKSTPNPSTEGKALMSTSFEKNLLSRINKSNPRTKRRRKIDSNCAVLTSAEYLEDIKQKGTIQKRKAQTKKVQKQKVQKIDRVPSFSSESESESVVLQDESDFDENMTLADLIKPNSDDEFETDSSEIQSGDYVLIKFATKKKQVYYVALVERIKGNEYSVSYLRRKIDKFVFPEMPEKYIVNKDDIVMKLPSPSFPEGTARISQKLTFSIDFEKFDVN